jgi:hypothetical protein
MRSGFRRRMRPEERSPEQVAHDDGLLVCTLCGRNISPNEISMQVGEIVVCFQDAPTLCLFLDFEKGMGGAALASWQAHCRGEI